MADGMQYMGKVLVICGFVIAAVGGLLLLSGKISWLGRHYRSEKEFYFLFPVGYQYYFKCHTDINFLADRQEMKKRLLKSATSFLIILFIAFCTVSASASDNIKVLIINEVFSKRTRRLESAAVQTGKGAFMPVLFDLLLWYGDFLLVVPGLIAL